MQTKNKEKIVAYKLPETLKVGAVEIFVQNLENMKHFYHEIMGLEIINETTTVITLGLKKTALLVLHNYKDFPAAHPTQAGLYHFAILFSSRGDLARTIYKMLKAVPQHFTGSADHLVSEAFYFNDPEGNGIELYYDRDRTLWKWENKQIQMATMYIDPNDYIQRHIVLEEPDTEVSMGHVHLKVGDIEKAKDFYVKILGFDVTAELPGALFISVGGYHHHIGMNTWESKGAGDRVFETLGLRHFELLVKDNVELTEIKNRLEEHNIIFKVIGNSITFHDPWKNQIKILHKTA